MPKPFTKPASARRKVRKGTRSCWECRGRKVKCVFLTFGPGDTCEGCILRGSKCVSQEQPEQPLAKMDRRVPLRNRLRRVEQLIGTLVRDAPETGILQLSLSPKVTVNPEKLGEALGGINHPRESQPSAGEPSQSTSALPATSETWNTTGSIPATVPNTLGLPSLPHKYQSMSEELLRVFPPEESVKLVVKLAGLVPPFFHQIAPKSLGQRDGFSETDKQNLVVELVTRHTYMTHPLVIVRQMLLLAIGFRYIHPASHESLAGLSEWPGETMYRMGEAAIELLEKNDSMLETPEALECLLLASSLHADSGNLRSAWSTTRRAMLLAQLVSLNRQTRPSARPLQSEDVWDPRLLWYRIVFFDRFFSLALGLPQGSTDIPMTDGSLSSGNDSPLWYLQRQHCAIAGRILQRNAANSVPQDIDDESIAIDHELQLSAQSMPTRWWLVPNLASITDDWELYQATLRLTEQVFHNILLTQLHLPFMLQATSMTSLPGSHQTSLPACVNASRDLLHRYMALRNFSSVSYCCHSMDFFAVTASVILLLGYLHDHWLGANKALWHQRATDRAIMEEILVNMAQTGTLNKASALSERGATVLGRLLNIEQRVWQTSAMRLVETHHDPDNDQRSADQPLRLIIPCLGIITVNNMGEIQITGDGGSTKTATLAENVNVQPASKINKSYQPGTANHITGSMALNALYSTNIPSDILDQSGQSDVLVSDAHMAFLTSVMENNGEFQGSESTDSWWLL